jgi:hypothetical protein
LLLLTLCKINLNAFMANPADPYNDCANAPANTYSLDAWIDLVRAPLPEDGTHHRLPSLQQWVALSDDQGRSALHLAAEIGSLWTCAALVVGAGADRIAPTCPRCVTLCIGFF